MSEKKITIVEQFNTVIAKAERGEPLTAKEIEFLKGRSEQSAKKSENRKATPTQIENEKFKDEIVAVMSANPNMLYTIGDLIKNVPAVAELTNQRVSAIVRQLKEANIVVRTESKGRAYFQIAK